MSSWGTFVNCTPVEGLFSATSQFETPPYQRDYVWDRHHWQELWNDIDRMCGNSSAEVPPLHFLGVVTLLPKESATDTRLIVDGQQRLTTLSLLLCAVRDSFENADDDASRLFRRMIWNAEINAPRLVPRYRNSSEYRDIARGKPPVGSSSPLAKAYRYFLRQLKDSPKTPEGIGLTTLRRLQVVWVVLDNDDAATRVFEDLNAKRVKLSQSDLIRSHVFARESASDQDYFDRHHWQHMEEGFQRKKSKGLDSTLFDDFFHHLLTCETRMNIPKTQIYRRFLTTVSEDESGSDITDRLRPLKERYLWIRGRQLPDDPALRDALDRVRRPAVSAAFPVALAVLNAHAEGAGSIGADERNRALDMLASFLIRGHMCGRNSREQWHALPGLCLLDNEDASVVRWLRSQLVANKWPDDPEFITKFVTHPLRKRSFQDAVVRGLERSRQHARGYSVQDEPPGIHVEHVLPKAIADTSNLKSLAWQKVLGTDWERLHDQWVDTAGNLALLAGRANASIGNAPFSEKKDYLIDAKTYLNEDFRHYGTWGVTQIKERGGSLAVEALEVWKGPSHSGWC